MSDTPQIQTLEQAQSRSETKIQAEPLYNVVLLDDDEHTYEYVVEMLCKLFGHSMEQAYVLACEVDREGRVIVDTTHLERAELKRDQIRAFGADRLLHGSSRSMHATIEPLTG